MTHKILILGKQPPPYMGTAVWFETLQKADWGEDWQVDFFNVNIHRSLETDKEHICHSECKHRPAGGCE
jgi:hypothetical protein